ncbi:MAG TPA: hypothetical protein VD995_20485 [Azospirillum sp.]|nr:hypothetical protein [Azospirillum sp.]
MRLRLSLGAALLSTMVALGADPAFAQTPNPKGSICLENAGGFVIEAEFVFSNGPYTGATRIVKAGSYPVLQTRCVEFTEDDKYVDVIAKVWAGRNNSCMIYLPRHAGNPIALKIHGTTLINYLECPR